MKQLYLLLLAILCSFGAQAQSFNKSLTFDGLTRNYIVHLPTGYDSTWTDVPLVFNLHGYTSNASQQQVYALMNNVADTAGFIVVYPDGINNAWNSFATGIGSTANDVGFISYLIDVLYSDYGNIDLKRVYTCGMSNGGYMSYRLACELSDRIAAMAGVTGLLALSIETTCSPVHPMPVLQIHGTNDATVPYNGGPGISSVDQTIQYWIGANNCPSTAVIDTLPDVDTNDGSTVIKYTYGLCDSNSQVILYKVVGGGHTWPGALVDLGGTNYDIDGSVEIWDFFSQYEHPNPRAATPVGITNTAVGSGFPIDFYPNPMGDRLHIKIKTDDVKQIALYDVLGAAVQVFSNIKTGETLQIDTRDLPPGIYMLQVDAADGRHAYKLMK